MNTDYRGALAGLMQERMDRLGLKPVDVATRTGLSKSYVSALLKGKVSLPGADKRRDLARVLGVRHVDLFVAAGELTVDEVAPPLKPHYGDDRLRVLAERWEQLTDPERQMIGIVLDRHLLRAGEEGIDNLAQIVTRRGDVAEAAG